MMKRRPSGDSDSFAQGIVKIGLEGFGKIDTVVGIGLNFRRFALADYVIDSLNECVAGHAFGRVRHESLS
jgi:hypothetical protein